VRLCENPAKELTEENSTMALDQSALLELTGALCSADSGELMHRPLHTMLQALIDAEATAHIGAAPHERTGTRTTQRNGTREKLVATTAGDLSVKIPKLRSGSFFPSLLAPRRRSDVALHVVVMRAWVAGVSTRKVDDLVAALGGSRDQPCRWRPGGVFAGGEDDEQCVGQHGQRGPAPPGQPVADWGASSRPARPLPSWKDSSVRHA
jgi:Transposase, Mutator family